MAADDGRSGALFVCTLCKARKKKCDKQFPRCSYCVKNNLRCIYKQHVSRNRAGHHLQEQLRRPASVTTPPSAGSSSPLACIFPSSVSVSATSLHQQVYQLIRASGRFVDDVSTSYFHSLHLYIPIISRSRFHDSLVTLGTSPSADFSVLLLSMHLVTLASLNQDHRERSPPDHRSHNGDGDSNNGGSTKPDIQSLYMTTKSVFAQVQSTTPPSIRLVQAALLIALYEYTRGEADQAFVTMSMCARLAYAARIHRSVGGRSDYPDRRKTRLEAREENNTWWGIVIWERAFLCEITVQDQSLITSMPGAEAPLPIESAALELSDAELAASFPTPEWEGYPPSAHLSALKQADIGAFGRIAQAAWLLDQVLGGFGIPNLDTRLACLRRLDGELRVFLSDLVQQTSGRRGPSCEAVSLTIRALFVLHGHVLDQLALVSDPEILQISHAALKSITVMIVDVADAHRSSDSAMGLPPTYQYNARAALRYIRGRQFNDSDAVLVDAEERLR